jgi:hypothetical protein
VRFGFVGLVIDEAAPDLVARKIQIVVVVE